MKRAGQALAICVVILGGFWANSTRAYQAPDAKAALAKDDSCITCHAGTGHVADIYQSRHGNKADPRTPGCVNCHGASDKHMTDPVGIAPDVVFAATSKRRSPATARSASCLSCHASHVLPRTLWAGSQHETRGVACTDCHNIHAADQKVLNKATQADVCFTCHKRPARRDPAPLDPSARDDRDRLAAHDGVLGLPQPARIERADAARQEHGQRDLLHVPRREARPVPLGARAGRRKLHQLPHAARLDQRRRCSRRARRICARSATAATTRTDQQRRQSRRRQRDDGQRDAAAVAAASPRAQLRGPRVPQLPRADPRLESSGRREVPALSHSRETVMTSNLNGSGLVRGFFGLLALGIGTDRVIAQTPPPPAQTRRPRHLMPQPRRRHHRHGGNRRRQRQQRLVQGRRIQRAEGQGRLRARGVRFARRRRLRQRQRAALARQGHRPRSRHAQPRGRSRRAGHVPRHLRLRRSPRNRSDSYQTPYNGAGTNMLTLPGTWQVPTRRRRAPPPTTGTRP